MRKQCTRCTVYGVQNTQSTTNKVNSYLHCVRLITFRKIGIGTKKIRDLSMDCLSQSSEARFRHHPCHPALFFQRSQPPKAPRAIFQHSGRVSRRFSSISSSLSQTQGMEKQAASLGGPIIRQ